MVRPVRLAFLSAALLAAGCATALVRAGADTDRLTTRDEVRAEFGAPDATGEADGWAFDHYRTRRKMSELDRSLRMGLSGAMSLGLSEILAFPVEVGRLVGNTAAGQDLRFTYDRAGRVTSVSLDGQAPGVLPRERLADPDAAAGPDERPQP